MKKIALLLALLLALLSACGFPSSENSYQLYYLNDLSTQGSALLSVTRYLPQEKSTIDPLVLLEAHISNGWEPDVKTPFPQGLFVISVQETLPSVVDVVFSEVYGDLSEMNRTVADYAVVKTLTQLPQVVGVRIHVQGTEMEEFGDVLREYDILTMD